ncbi:MAG: hypothetical protein ACLQVN_08125 [Bryobacteraceae bacterium]
MGCDRSISKATNRMGVASRTAPGRHVHYFGAAARIDVMFEQLEYLLTHESQDCPAGCEDCKRLKKAERWLLLPFHAAASRQASKPAAAARPGRLQPQT